MTDLKEYRWCSRRVTCHYKALDNFIEDHMTKVCGEDINVTYRDGVSLEFKSKTGVFYHMQAHTEKKYRHCVVFNLGKLKCYK